jgi:hypothetical protein
MLCAPLQLNRRDGGKLDPETLEHRLVVLHLESDRTILKVKGCFGRRRIYRR